MPKKDNQLSPAVYKIEAYHVDHDIAYNFEKDTFSLEEVLVIIKTGGNTDYVIKPAGPYEDLPGRIVHRHRELSRKERWFWVELLAHGIFWSAAGVTPDEEKSLFIGYDPIKQEFFEESKSPSDPDTLALPADAGYWVNDLVKYHILNPETKSLAFFDLFEEEVVDTSLLKEHFTKDVIFQHMGYFMNDALLPAIDYTYLCQLERGYLKLVEDLKAMIGEAKQPC